MLNIIVENCNGKLIKYELDNVLNFVLDMESDNEILPMLDDVLVEVETDNNELYDWWKDKSEGLVSNLVDFTKSPICNGLIEESNYYCNCCGTEFSSVSNNPICPMCDCPYGEDNNYIERYGL